MKHSADSIPGQRSLGYWTATAIIVGSIIGSGVFMKPAAMAAQLASPYGWPLPGFLLVFSLYLEHSSMPK